MINLIKSFGEVRANDINLLTKYTISNGKKSVKELQNNNYVKRKIKSFLWIFFPIKTMVQYGSIDVHHNNNRERFISMHIGRLIKSARKRSTTAEVWDTDYTERCLNYLYLRFELIYSIEIKTFSNVVQHNYLISNNTTTNGSFQ